LIEHFLVITLYVFNPIACLPGECLPFKCLKKVKADSVILDIENLILVEAAGTGNLCRASNVIQRHELTV
jgi:hypothetical protein